MEEQRMYEVLKGRLETLIHTVSNANQSELIDVVVKSILEEIKSDKECFDRYGMLTEQEKNYLKIIMNCLEIAIKGSLERIDENGK